MSLDDLFGPSAQNAPEPEPQSKPPKAPRPPKPPREPRAPREPRDERSRTPLILGIIAGILLVAVIVTLGFALTRPSASAPPDAITSDSPNTAAPEGTTSPSPSPSASTVGVPTSLRFAATGFVLADAEGRTAFTFGWSDTVQPAVAALTDVFGAAPTQRIQPGDGSDYPDYTVYQWDGFMLFDMIEKPGGTPRAQYPQPTYVLFSRNQIGTIALQAERGLTIGMPVAAVRALAPESETPRGNVGAIRFVFDGARSKAAGPPQYSVIVDTDGTAVTAILYFRYAAS